MKLKQIKNLKKLLERDSFFDKVFYLRHYHDARLAEATPIDHYIKVGINENRKPNSNFDSEWYLQNYTDVNEAGINPVIHFIIHGLEEGRLQNSEEKQKYDEIIESGNFDVAFYKNNYEDLQDLNDKFDLITHYVRHGQYEGRVYINPSTSDEQSEVEIKATSEGIVSSGNQGSLYVDSTQFDLKYYLENNPDVAEADVNPEWHYFTYGEKEGRKPNSYFDPNFYLRLNSDVRTAKIPPFTHYCQNGFYENRLCSQTNLDTSVKKSTKKKPLLFIGHDAIQAGAQVVLLETVKWFAQATDRNVKVLLLSPGPLADKYAKYSQVYVLNNAEIDDDEFLQDFLNEEFEFVFLSTVVSGKFISILQELDISINAPFIAYIHEMAKVLEIYSDELSQLVPEVNLWISGSPETTKVLKNKYRLPKDKIETVTAFVKPVTSISADNSLAVKQAREELGIDVNDFVVMGCGTAYWRKGPDLFLETARKLISQNISELKFIWIGDGEDKDNLVQSLTKKERKYIEFIGHKSNANELFAAADLFYLSSREDPFPLVVLHAAQFAIPTVFFDGTTGVSEFIQHDAGVAVKDLSVNEAAEIIKDLVNNCSKLDALGNAAKERLFTEYTSDVKMLQVFASIVKHTSYTPSVSAIIPFYNHEKFLNERIDSILDQSIKDIEVLCLDDCSTDNSVKVAKQYLRDPRVKLQLNKQNSGSPFKQWKKGIKLAKSEVVWIAEGDDACSRNFLEELLPAFDDPFVNISYARFEMIDENSQLKKDAFKPYFEMISPTKFTQPYVNTGLKEIQEHFAAYQTLINASGLLIRKASFSSTLDQAKSYKMCGDWLIYLECLKNGKISYNPNAINLFRRHSASQVVKIEGTEQYFRERYEITDYIVENNLVTKKQLLNSFKSIDSEWMRFKHKHKDTALNSLYNKKALIENLSKKNGLSKPNLLVVVSDLSPGGGQIFSIRLANAWNKNSGNVILLNVNKHPTHQNVLSKIDEKVPFFDISDIDLKEIIEIYDINIIHSSIWWADKYIHDHYKTIPEHVKWVITMHGCHEALIASPNIDQSFNKIFPEMVYEADCWVYIAEKNLKSFDETGQPVKIENVFNGYEPETPTPLVKKELGLREDATVVCLASRANEDKGWLVAAQAVKDLNAKGTKVDLLLLGEGPAAEKIKKNTPPEYIKLMGHVSNVQDYIAVSDIGLLPSTFISESMPQILIEFMSQGKPIVATDIGEIKNMTQDSDGSASIILDLHNGNVASEQVSEAITEIVSNKTLQEKLEENSFRRFQFFSMDVMLDNYTKIYHNILDVNL